MTSISLAKALEDTVRDVPDFPKPGILFKDITPILKDPVLCDQVVTAFYRYFADKKIDVIVGIESRGFLFGMLLAGKLGVPFVPIRKKGRLPAETHACEYDLEYGSATIEIHADAFPEGANVLIHDDLLATGGTVVAASKLVRQMGGRIGGYAFLINLDFIGGKEQLRGYSNHVLSLVDY